MIHCTAWKVKEKNGSLSLRMDSSPASSEVFPLLLEIYKKRGRGDFPALGRLVQDWFARFNNRRYTSARVIVMQRSLELKVLSPLFLSWLLFFQFCRQGSQNPKFQHAQRVYQEIFFRKESALSLTGLQMTESYYSVLRNYQITNWMWISRSNQKIFAHISLPMQSPRP